MRFIQEITVGHQAQRGPTGTVIKGQLIDSDNYSQTVVTQDGTHITINRQHMITTRSVRVN